MKSRLGVFCKILFFFTVFINCVNCSSSRYFKIEEAEKNQSVRLFLKNGEVKEGIVLNQADNALTIVDAKDHEPATLQHSEIRQIEFSQTHFDYEAYPISKAEISKHKKSRNAWGYAFGGAAIGAAVGLAIITPIWLANDNPPPLFGAGIGLVVGSIYFGSKGIKKDREIAITHVREMRGMDNQLAQEKAAEEEKLKEIEKEKQELLKKLEKKKGQEDSGN